MVAERRVTLEDAAMVVLPEAFALNYDRAHYSHPIRNCALNSIEKNEAAHEEDHDYGGRDQHYRAGRLAMTGKRPAEPVNNTCHRIESI